MIVFDLQCGANHTFEGWFASASVFDSQLAQGLVECPMCSGKSITKKLSSPRINLGAIEPKAAGKSAAHSSPSSALAPADAVTIPAAPGAISVQNNAPANLSPQARETIEKMQSMWLEMARHVVANTEDVGTSFAEEARKIHYKEAPERNIRGTASADESAALLEEGIDIHTFPLPEALKGPLQ